MGSKFPMSTSSCDGSINVMSRAWSTARGPNSNTSLSAFATRFEKQKGGFEKVSRVHHGFAHGGSLLEVGATEHRLRVLETLNLSPLDNDATWSQCAILEIYDLNFAGLILGRKAANFRNKILVGIEIEKKRLRKEGTALDEIYQIYILFHNSMFSKCSSDSLRLTFFQNSQKVISKYFYVMRWLGAKSSSSSFLA